MNTLTSLTDVKVFLNIETSDYDTFLWSLITQASSVVENYCDRCFQLKRVVEYYDGDGTSLLRVKRYPIRDIHALYVDTSLAFTGANLLDSSYYVFYTDMGLVRNLTGSFPRYPSCIKIDYDGGYGVYIEDGVNDSLVLREGEESYTVTVTSGYYTPEGLAAAVETAISDSNPTNTYSVSHTERTGLITISADGTFDLLLSQSTIAEDLGFSSTDQTGNSSYTGTKSVVGVPEAITMATTMIASLLFQQSYQGDRRLGRRSRTIERGGTESFDPSHMPEYITGMLDPYVRRWCL